jgi:predicted aspartyl protease
VSCHKRSAESFEPAHGVEMKLHDLLEQHEYFDLRDLLMKFREKVPSAKYHFFSAFVLNAFNQNTLSIETINDLIKTEHNLPDSLVAELLVVQRDNYIKTFNYKMAAETGKQIVEQFKNLLDEKEISDIKTNNRIYEGLKQSASQRTILTENAIVNWKRDKVGLMTIPVSTDGAQHDFIFDTRASISVIMKSYADKLKLRMLGVRYTEGSGTTGKTFESELGMADSLTIGNIKVFNVVFQVLADEILSFPSMDYSMKGIIGFPVIVQWRHFQINQSGTITILDEPDTSSLQNLAFEESAVVLHARGDDDTLSFYLDSGANHSQLFANYFLRKDSLIKQVARIDTIEVGGVGGIVRQEIYSLPNFTIQIGDQSAELEHLQVLTKPTYPDQKYYGNLGQDVLAGFTEITFDFVGMSLFVK